ncbi:putative meiotic expression up-regulated protein 26 [Vairimorpha necatrix]|uniref:Meiotic expression up-regulated protein 26 n=1 Tax=Vairimorpha necatrix TaxID=6039 RepID=A0AAX4JG72_9MICR
MKNPVLNLNSFCSSPLFLLNSDDMSLLESPFSLDEYKVPNKKSNFKPTDYYKPSKTRGLKEDKEGYCLECDTWLKLKNSSYWYHMNFIHGINSKGMKYPEPEIIRKNNGKNEGYCGICEEWINLGSKRDQKRCKFGWYRHCQKIHK